MRNDSRYNGFMIIHIDGIKENFIRQKDRQKADIFAYLARNGPAARKDITKALYLRSTTVSMLVQELVDDGLIAEGQSITRGRPGRPDIGLSLAPERLVAATIYVDDKELVGSLVDIAGNFLIRETLRLLPKETNGEIAGKYKRLFNTLRRAAPRASEFLGIGISAAGTIDEKNCIWVNVNRWPKIRDLDIGKLGREEGIPILLRRNLDIELAYILEQNPKWRKENTILFHWGSIIGGAYAYQGKILDSAAGRYMDIGHTIVHSKSRKRCRCGLYGCLEAEAASYALLPILRKRFPGLKTGADIDSFLGDPKILAIPDINHAIDAVGLSLSNLFKIFYPHRIFLVGSFTRNTKIVERLEHSILKTLVYAKMKDKPRKINLVVIPDGFSGCARANAYPFFRNRFTDLLTAKN